MKLLILIDGLRQSGKTTMGDALAAAYRQGFEWDSQRVMHIEPTFYFFDKDGNYHFDKTKLSQANTWMKVSVKGAMRDDREDVIVISHHFRNLWEKKYYTDLAELHGFQVQEIYCKAQFKHVPLNKVELEIKELLTNIPQPVELPVPATMIVEEIAA